MCATSSLRYHFYPFPNSIYLPCRNLCDRFSFPSFQTGNVYLEQECVLMQSVCTLLPASVDMSTSTIVLFDHLCNLSPAVHFDRDRSERLYEGSTFVKRGDKRSNVTLDDQCHCTLINATSRFMQQ